MNLRPFVLICVASVIACSSSTPPAPPPAAREAPTSGDDCPRFAQLSEGLPTSRAWRVNPSLAALSPQGPMALSATTRKYDHPKVFLFDPVTGWRDGSAGLQLDLYPCGIGTRLADVVGDPRPELIVADHCTGLYLFEQDGDTGWRRLMRIEHPSGEGFNDAAAGDIDGDGRTDIVALAAFTTGLTVFRQRAGGAFEMVDSGLPTSGGGYVVELADLNGDGRLDIVSTLQRLDPALLAKGMRGAKVWLQRDGGSWVPGEGLPEEGNFYGVAWGDLDENGTTDLVFSMPDGEGMPSYLGTGQGTWELSANPPAPAGGRYFAGVILADLDRDGHLDLAALERTDNSLRIWLGDGTGRMKECSRPIDVMPEPWKPGWGLTAGDINGDGRLDLAAGFGGETGGGMRAWVQEQAAQ